MTNDIKQVLAKIKGEHIYCITLMRIREVLSVVSYHEKTKLQYNIDAPFIMTMRSV